MDSADFFQTHFASMPAMGIFRNQTPEATVRLCHAAWDFGIDLVEIPVQSRDALPSLAAAVEAGRRCGRIVGAGTVTTPEQLTEVHKIGAQFTVAPGLDDDVIVQSARISLPHLPGVATATEIARAYQQGLSWLKAFPAAQLGTAWIKAQHGPFPQMNFVATGGIDTKNAQAFLAAGCSAVALGSALADLTSLASFQLFVPQGETSAH